MPTRSSPLCYMPASSGFATVFLYCALAVFTVPTHADDWYQVEVVLFAYTEPDAGGELWYENPGLPARRQTIGLIMETVEPLPGVTPDPSQEDDLMPYLALPKQNYRLAGVRRVMASSREYRHLLHVAWQQPGLDARNVRAVRLDNTRFERKAAEQVEVEPEPGQVRDEPEYTPPIKIFDGTVKLRKSRFLHLDVDFAYFPDVLQQPDLEMPAQSAGHRRFPADYVRLTESRRIKPDDLNYFDHPLFGLVVEVSKIVSADDAD
ncbi:MAG: hypothetical protein F4147_06655 [Gammaproteobacteria bacterium]|nr:hypothetical protein [Gammaproteobacteria bacterium]